MDRSTNFIKFLLALTLLQIVSSSRTCTHDNLKATDRWQIIKSPDFPKPFPAQTQCSWRHTWFQFSLPFGPVLHYQHLVTLTDELRISTVSGSRIKLQFSGFNLAFPDAKGRCTRQWLNIQFREKVADAPPSFFTLCGRDSPGTIVSPGNILLLNLHSGSDAIGSKYLGFQASYSITTESAVLPGESSPPQQKKNPTQITRRRKPLTQNERIELMNRRRNQGLDVNDNPVFDTNGNPIDSYTRRTTKATIKPVTQYVPHYVPPKRGKTISNEMKAVIIVISIIVVAFVLLLVARKLNMVDRIRKMHQRRKEAAADARNNMQVNTVSSGRMRTVEEGLGSKGGKKKVKKKKASAEKRKRPKAESGVEVNDAKKKKKRRKRAENGTQGSEEPKKRKTKESDPKLQKKRKVKQRKRTDDETEVPKVPAKPKKRREASDYQPSSNDGRRNTRTAIAYTDEKTRAQRRRQRPPEYDDLYPKRAPRARHRHDRHPSDSSSPGYFSDSSEEDNYPRRR